ncbi:MAG: MYXO-CTERM sorting domain-containing protein [Sandaracinaceae bacterium]
MSRRLVALTALAIVCALPSAASAHGRPPFFGRIERVSGSTDRMIARATFGIVTTDDGGGDWRWICAAGIGYDPTSEDPPVLAQADGSVLVGGFRGLIRSEPDRCAWSRPIAELTNVYVIDIESLPSDPSTVYAVSTDGAGPDYLFVSFDGGGSFVPVSEPVDEVLLERVRVAPSDPMRVYLSGAQPMSASNPTRRGFFFRSDDGGQTLTRIEVELVDEERNVHLLAVDPTDPDRVLVRMTRREDDVRDERVLLTEDGGETFTEVLTTRRVSGAVFSSDGARAWLTAALGVRPPDGAMAGLFVSDDGGASFTRRQDGNLTCVARFDDELWICAYELTDGYSLARSTDGGDSFTTMLEFHQLGRGPDCGVCTPIGFTCPGWYPDLAYDLRLDGGMNALPDGSVTGAPRDAAPPAQCIDGGLVDAGPPEEMPTCGCRTASRSGPSWVGWALLSLALLGRRRRTHRGTAATVI